MKNCEYCKSEIEDKTKSGKERKFCNKSCSRKHYVENNKDKLAEASKKGYKTLLENNPEAIKHRGRSTERKRKAAEELHKKGHFHKMSDIGNTTRKKEGNSEKQIAKWKETYESNGHMLGPNPKWNQYSRKCRRLTTKLYGSVGDGMEWDHTVPLLFGFKNDITPEQICSKENITKMTIRENRKKGHKLTKDSMRVLEMWGMEGEWGWEDESYAMCGLDGQGCAA